MTVAVTQADAIRFIEHALRNWRHVPRISADELEDLRDGLQHFAARAIEQARAEAVEEAARVADDHVERLSASALRMWTVQVAKAQLAARIAAAIRSLSAPLAGGEG
jgi:hypothetical protein